MSIKHAAKQMWCMLFNQVLPKRLKLEEQKQWKKGVLQFEACSYFIQHALKWWLLYFAAAAYLFSFAFHHVLPLYFSAVVAVSIL